MNHMQLQWYATLSRVCSDPTLLSEAPQWKCRAVSGLASSFTVVPVLVAVRLPELMERF